MPVSDWFKAREQRKYTVVTPGAAAEVPDGVWLKCAGCKRAVYRGDFEKNLYVCPHCGHHAELSAPDRVRSLADEGSFEETDATITSSDPLRFTAAKPYAATLDVARETTGLPEAVMTGRALTEGHPVVLGVMDFRFIGASMGTAVGEKVARAFDRAREERRAVVFVTASGGARMQEGMLSLMQMAKTAAAVRRFSDAGLPYVAVLANPTYGGVTASFPVLADVILAEPGAMVGFAGPKLVEETTRQSLPKGFQTAESLVRHGFVDAVVPRTEMKAVVGRILDYLCAPGMHPAAEGAACPLPEEVS
jgi:acetyl-CoA carboxylase carboxyl transferase subunit beta